MIRLAHEADIPTITKGMLQLKQSTAWSAYHQDQYTYEALSQFVSQRLYDPQSVCYVSEDRDGQLRAFCGGSLNQFYLPPHMPLVFEWGWFGTPREATRCWQSVVQWGKRHGAELAGRVRSTPGQHPGKIIEQQVWKVIR